MNEVIYNEPLGVDWSFMVEELNIYTNIQIQKTAKTNVHILYLTKIIKIHILISAPIVLFYHILSLARKKMCSLIG